MLSATKIRNLITPALSEWQQLAKKVKAEEDACAAKTKKDRDRMAALELQIQLTMSKGFAPNQSSVVVQTVETESAIAEVKDEGCRQIDPEEFFKAIPAKDRKHPFWGCLKVGIGKAEKYLPKALMEKLAIREPKLTVKVRLKK